MVKVSKTYTLLSLTGATGASTPLSFKNTERATVQVDIVNPSGLNTTVDIKGTTDASSSGTYVTLDTQTKTADSSYAVEINGAYTYIKVECTAIDSASGTVDVSIITQGEGY